MARNIQITLPKEGGDFGINLFGAVNFACITGITMEVIDMPPGSTVTIAGNAFWNSMSQAQTITAAAPSLNIPQGSCCWSAKVSELALFTGVAPTTAGPDGVTLDFTVFGLPWDCADNSSSSYEPCPAPQNSSSSSSSGS